MIYAYIAIAISLFALGFLAASALYAPKIDALKAQWQAEKTRSAALAAQIKDQNAAVERLKATGAQAQQGVLSAAATAARAREIADQSAEQEPPPATADAARWAAQQANNNT